MTGKRGAEWRDAIAAVRSRLEKLRSDKPLPTLDKSFIDAPIAWRDPYGEADELVPLGALRGLLEELEAEGPTPSQAFDDGWFEGYAQATRHLIARFENLVTTDPAVIAWREESIKSLRRLRNRAYRHDRDLR